MAITKEVIVDQITVVENGEVLYRTATKILEDGVEISKKYHRETLYPGADLSGRPSNVVAICNTVWTPEVIAATQQARADQAAALDAKYGQPTQGV